MNFSEKKYYSVLRNTNKAVVNDYPYPHVIIRDALPAELADALTNQFPIRKFDGLSNNTRSDLISSEVLQQHDIPTKWTKFIEFHSTQDFLTQIIEVFGEHIVRQNPRQYPTLEHLHQLKAGRRYINSFSEADVLMDAHISTNSPVTKVCSVRQVHVDNPNKLFSGLIYFRQPEDDSVGGNLQLCKWKSEYKDRQKTKNYRENLSEDYFSVVDEVKYENNVCILFLNSLDALHGVTPRSVTSCYRTFANFVGLVPYQLYSKNRKQIFSYAKLRRKLGMIKRRLLIT